MKTITTSLVGKTINTIKGTALYSHTEIENESGKWNDHWYTKFGEYVIHDGVNHHVYFVQGE